ncbi:MAG: 4Fe-4S dicluster domain-containing protein [Leptospirales bacterium]|nr:4Fe-4S dicluster domain-containing protein [Leptospirales bacterium]
MAEKAFLVDTSKCQGCRGCQVACKQWNGLPAEETTFFEGPEVTNPKKLTAKTWNHVVFFPVDRSDANRPIWTIMHKKCFHCNDANCLNACPEKAIFKQNEWTVIDQDKCIGCSACVNSCIYKVPELSEINFVNDAGQKILKREKSHKCNACTLNTRAIPACVSVCPSNALLFDYRLKMIKYAKARVKVLKAEGYPGANVYGLDQFHGLGVITVLRDNPEKYGLPLDTKKFEIKMTNVEATHNVYALLSSFTMGIPMLKKAAYKISKSLTKDA